MQGAHSCNRHWCQCCSWCRAEYQWQVLRWSPEADNRWCCSREDAVRGSTYQDMCWWGWGEHLRMCGDLVGVGHVRALDDIDFSTAWPVGAVHPDLKTHIGQSQKHTAAYWKWHFFLHVLSFKGHQRSLTSRPTTTNRPGHVCKVTNHQALVDGDLALDPRTGPSALTSIWVVDVCGVYS